MCVFLKQKIYILIHIDLYGRVGYKKSFTRPISGKKTTFFGLIVKFPVCNGLQHAIDKIMKNSGEIALFLVQVRADKITVPTFALPLALQAKER